MRLRDHLRADLVLTDLDAPDRSAALEAVAKHVAEREPAVDFGALLHALEAREAAFSTAMGHGLALPHATLEGLDATALGVARTRTSIPWGDEGQSARLLFVLLSPPGCEGTHIKLLARVCRLVRTPGVSEHLMAADSPDRLVAAVLEHDEADA